MTCVTVFHDNPYVTRVTYLYMSSDLLGSSKAGKDSHSGNYPQYSYTGDYRSHSQRHIHSHLYNKRKIQCIQSMVGTDP